MKPKNRARRLDPGGPQGPPALRSVAMWRRSATRGSLLWTPGTARLPNQGGSVLVSLGGQFRMSPDTM
jgi:hypothetical protein